MAPAPWPYRQSWSLVLKFVGDSCHLIGDQDTMITIVPGPCMKIVNTADPSLACVFAQIGQRSFTQTFGHLYQTEDLDHFLANSHSVDIYQSLLADPAHALWLAYNDDQKPVGYAVCGPCTLPVPDMPDHSGELARLYVLREAQGSGLGTRLLQICLSWLEDNFQHLFLSVYAENTGAQKLYRRHGFEKIHDYHYMVGNHADPEWIMKRAR